MFSTVLAARPATPPLVTARWLQLADLLAQKGPLIDPALAEQTLCELAALRSQIALSHRIRCAQMISPLTRFAPLAAFFAHDAPAVAAAMLRHLHLGRGEWDALVPALGPVAREILLQREDIDAPVRALLTAMGSAHLHLTHQPTQHARVVAQPEPSPEAPEIAQKNAGDVPVSQIDVLVRRIEAFRYARDHPETKQPSAPELPESLFAAEPVDRFSFSTGSDGSIDWVDGAPPGPVIGIELGEPASGNLPGPSAAAAAAFRRRGEIRDARIVLFEHPSLDGEWRFSASPRFDAASGRFEGYVGQAARVENALRGEATLAQAEIQGDSIRQLIHELRTPLNAISGFAQIIEAQMMGSVGDSYRDLAAQIGSDAGASLAMIENLDMALTPQPQSDATDRCDAAHVLAGVVDALGPTLERNAVRVVVEPPSFVPEVGVASGLLERTLARLLEALVQLANGGERILVRIADVSGSPGVPREAIGLLIARPVSLATCSIEELRNPGYDETGRAPDAGRLGLGFSLRLMENLARGAGGAFVVEPDVLLLVLPGASGVSFQRGEAG